MPSAMTVRGKRRNVLGTGDLTNACWQIGQLVVARISVSTEVRFLWRPISLVDVNHAPEVGLCSDLQGIRVCGHEESWSSQSDEPDEPHDASRRTVACAYIVMTSFPWVRPSI